MLLAYLYNLSARLVERSYRSTFDGRLFLDAGMSDPTPNHSTLSFFQPGWSRIEAAKEPDGGWSEEKRHERLEERCRHIFSQILQEDTRLRIECGPIRAADSVHTVANVNDRKERIRQEKGLPSADPDATVVNKGGRDVTKAGGEVVRNVVSPSWLN